MPEGVEEGIVRGLYPLKKSAKKGKKRVQLMSAGTIMREVEAAAVILEKDYGVAADIWSMTSVNELARDGHKVSRRNMMNPAAEPEVPFVTQCLAPTEGPIIAATDYIRAHTNQIREFMPRSFTVLGTDGFGRSDTRAQLREFFEVDRRYVVLAAMTALAEEGVVSRADVAKVMTDLGIDPAKPDPTTV
jgi:pyruvate dehydrogenase E1 component